MKLINAFIQSQHFEGKVTKETEKALFIKGNVSNWIPKSVFFERCEKLGRGPGQDVETHEDIEIDIYYFDCPYWMTVNKEQKGYAF